MMLLLSLVFAGLAAAQRSVPAYISSEFNNIGPSATRTVSNIASYFESHPSAVSYFQSGWRSVILENPTWFPSLASEYQAEATGASAGAVGSGGLNLYSGLIATLPLTDKLSTTIPTTGTLFPTSTASSETSSTISVSHLTVTVTNVGSFRTDQPIPDTNLQTEKTSSDLSTGAKAGIGIGCAVGGVILIVLVAYLVLWRKRKNRMARRSQGGEFYNEKPDHIGPAYAQPPSTQPPYVAEMGPRYWESPPVPELPISPKRDVHNGNFGSVGSPMNPAELEHPESVATIGRPKAISQKLAEMERYRASGII